MTALKSRRLILPAMAALVLAGCASGPPFIDQMQPQAVSMAERRGQFEMNCPAAKGKCCRAKPCSRSCRPSATKG